MREGSSGALGEIEECEDFGIEDGGSELSVGEEDVRPGGEQSIIGTVRDKKSNIFDSRAYLLSRNLVSVIRRECPLSDQWAGFQCKIDRVH